MSKRIGAVAVSELIKRGVLAIGDGYRAKNSEMGQPGVPFARAGNINGGFQFQGADILSADSVCKAGEKVSRPGDVVFTSKGTVGRFGFVSPNTQAFVYSPQLCYWRSLDREVIDPRFLFYWMHGPEATAQIGWAKGQTDMADYVSLKDQRQAFKITLPDIHEQRRIARILGSLDDKIELNRRMNQTLEAIARALFKSWFVDFDPVRAKAEGRDTGLPKHIADLFPDRFVDSELGEIPEGWGVSEIGNEVETVGGSTPSTKNPDFWDGGLSWATPKDLSSLTAPVLLETARTISNEGLAKISSGMLPEGTILMSSRAPVGYLAIAAKPVAINQGFIAMKCSGQLPNYFVLNWAQESMDLIKSNASGSTFAEISKKSFRPLPILVPDNQILTVFVETVDPIYRQIKARLHENGVLSTLRDALLPKLLSGDVGAIEHAVAEAMG